MKMIIASYFIAVFSFMIYDINRMLNEEDNNKVEIVFEEEAYIDDIPFNTKEIVDSLK